MNAVFKILVDSGARNLFVISLCMVSMLYGVISGHYELFPQPQLLDAKSAAEALLVVLSDDSVSGTTEQRNTETHVINHSGTDDGALMLISGGPGHLESYNPNGGCLAWLMDRSGRIRHVWRLDPELWSDMEAVSGVPGHSKVYPVGVHLLDDGGLIASFQGTNTWPFAIGMARFDKDSNLIWKKECFAHHWFIVTPDQKIITPTLKIIDSPQTIGRTRGRIKGKNSQVFEDMLTTMSLDGEMIEEVSMLEAIHESGWIGLYQGAAQPTESLDVVTNDPLHLNSVQRVGEQVAMGYEWLNPDDLLVSFRSINTIAILDRSTSRFKWLMAGATLRQHSPRFMANGDILAFDNAGGDESLGGTRLVRIGLDDREAETLFPTQEHSALGKIYSKTAGHMDVHPNSTAVLMTVSRQSAVYEINLDDRRVLWEYHFADAVAPHHVLTAKYCYDVSFEMNQAEK